MNPGVVFLEVLLAKVLAEPVPISSLTEPLLQLPTHWRDDHDPLVPHVAFKTALREGHLVPVCFTCGRENVGVRELMQIIANLCPNPAEGNPPTIVYNVNGETRTARARKTAAKVAAKGDPAAALESMIENLKTAVRERDSYRAALEKIAGLIRDELSG